MHDWRVPMMSLSRLSSAVLMVVAIGVAGCGGQTRTATSQSATASSAANSWVEGDVTFPVQDMTVYGTFRHPAGQARPVPAALLVAGSGPTDRNGNSRITAGQIGTLQNLAQALSNNGVASLRYDKLGTGQTGLGSYATDPATVDLAAFQDEATAALTFLAGQPGVDRTHLMVIGHSEGALYGLLLATAAPGTAPSVHALGLVEPASRRILDQLSEQAHAQADAAVQAGRVTAAQAAQETAAIDAAIQEFRATGNVPPDEPPGLKPVINAANAQALRQEDAIDPAAAAAKLPHGMPVLVTCSDADMQISCQDVDYLVSGLTSAGTKTDYVHLTGVDHVLKEDTSKTSANYARALPFSTQLTGALTSFIKENF
jgi:pimeloyl-ACP methyl ester carboxylesterase